MLIHKKPDDPQAAAAALTFFDWAYKTGAGTAKDLQYVAIPGNVVALVEKSWQDITADGKPLFTPK